MKSVIRMFSLLLVTGLAIQGCTEQSRSLEQDAVREVSLPSADGFQTSIHGVDTELYHLEADGIRAAFTNYGARLVSLLVKDTNDQWIDMVLGFDNIEAYTQAGALYYGATVGRYANRLDSGRFTIEGKPYQTPPNDGANSLHGGMAGLSQQVWTVSEATNRSLSFTYVSPDGEMGFPGDLTTQVTYSIEGGPFLKIDYTATTNKPTVINLTHHSYFNLNGEGSGTIVDHLLQVPADSMLPVNRSLIPTGEIRAVEGTAFDFRDPVAFSNRIDADTGQVRIGRGYDHTLILSMESSQAYHNAATVTGDKSKIQMTVLTTEPGIQVYSGNFMNGSLTGKGGNVYGFREGFCLETQHFPDSPNHPDWPSTTLMPGVPFHSSTIYKFRIPR